MFRKKKIGKTAEKKTRMIRAKIDKIAFLYVIVLGIALSGCQVQQGEEENTISTIYQEEAANIAIRHAGLDINQVENEKIKLVNENDIVTYEISFSSEGNEYWYKLSTTTGEIISYSHGEGIYTLIPEEGHRFYGQNNATQRALELENKTEDEVEFLLTQLIINGDSAEYKIEYYFEGQKYTVLLDGYTGERKN